jgi:ribosomal protein S18 acetylase RimI-like enzyme
MEIRTFTMDRYDEVLALWRRTPGICVRDADSRDAIERYLRRNPGLSFLGMANGKIVGCALSGHDGRRGYLQHVVVDPVYRRRGLAQELVLRCLAALEGEGILKVHLEVLVTNVEAHDFWTRRGWKRRDDIHRFSIIRSESQNA